MIVTTKLHIPRSRHPVVSRPRLMRLLDEGKAAKLTLVSAQAGYGKTTMLSEWITRNRTLAAWVSLDRSDNDCASFWRYVIASIGQHVQDFGVSCLPLLEAEASSHPELAVKALLNELNCLPDELIIVLDDYHNIESPSIHDSLSYVLERLPPPIRICIASRTELPFPITRLIAKGDLHRVDMQDLKFRLDEGLTFFQKATDLSLTREQATRLVHQTEGWISGLQLAAISLKRSAHLAESVRQLDGRQHLIFDYLLEEVFSGLPQSLRDFLLETSVLTRMNRSLCQAVTGQSNSQELLEQLEQLNLFIIPLDEQRHWYRYHSLLVRFLNQLLSRTNPDKLVQSHIRAANWFELHGFREDAVEHYLEGGRHEDAIRVIENNLPSFMQANVSTLRRWMSVLPEASWTDKPLLTLFSITALVVSGQWDTAHQRAEHAKSRFEGLKERLSPDEWRQAMGNLHFFCGVASFLHQNLERASSCFELAEQLIPEGSPYQMMGRNRYHGHDSHHDLLTVLRDLREAEPFFLRWIQAWEHKRQFPFIGYMYAAYCCLLYEWNRLEEAERYIDQVQAREDMRPYARMMANIALIASRIQQARGRASQALEQLRLLETEIDSPDHLLFVQKIQSERVSLSLRLGLLQPGKDWMKACEISPTDELTQDRIAEYLLLARVFAFGGQFEDALGLLEKLNRVAASGEFLREQIQVAIAHSVTLWRAGRKKAAHQMLEHALRKAEPQGYIRSFIDEGSPMAEMLAELAKREAWLTQPALKAYVLRLLEAFDDEPRDEAASKPVLTTQETKVLILISEGLVNKEIADRLEIKVETVKYYIKIVYRKLKANNRVQAVQRARQWDILH
jgi:ATP-dependent transcriptional regulator